MRLIRLLLAHGDYIAAGLPPFEINDDDRAAEFRELIEECKSSRKDREGWKDRIRGIHCDGRKMSQTQSALAEAIKVFGRIDILLCNTSEGKFTKFDSQSFEMVDVVAKSKDSCNRECGRTVHNNWNPRSGTSSIRSNIF